MTVASDMRRHNLKTNLYLICLLFISLLSVNSSEAWEFKTYDTWDNTERALLVTKLTLHTVDMFQTNYIFSHDEYHEINPVIDKIVDKFGTKALPVWFIGTGILDWAIADFLPKPYRKTWLTASAALSAVCVYNNQSIGIGFDFTF